MSYCTFPKYLMVRPYFADMCSESDGYFYRLSAKEYSKQDNCQSLLVGLELQMGSSCMDLGGVYVSPTLLKSMASMAFPQLRSLKTLPVADMMLMLTYRYKTPSL
jgi:hypothetical protein